MNRLWEARVLLRSVSCSSVDTAGRETLHVFVDTQAPRDWDALIRDMPGSNPFQTTAWARFQAAYMQAQPLFLSARDRSGAVEAALLALATAPRQTIWLDLAGGDYVASALRWAVPKLTWVGGPLVRAEGQTIEAAQRVVRAAWRWVRRHHGAGIFEVTLPFGSPIQGEAAAFQELRPVGARHATLLVDLQVDDVTAGFRSSARKALRRAAELGVQIREVRDHSELYDYYAFARSSRAEMGLGTHSIRNLLLMWDCLHPAGELALLLAEHGGRTIASLGVWCFGDVAVEFAALQSRGAAEQNLFGGDALKLEALRWAQCKGARYFDLAGVSVEPANAKERGIRQFKEKWGGQLVSYESFTRPTGLYSRIGRALHHLAASGAPARNH
ncbi:MAG TPA: GNAT family N-acetyltransferase [Chloroflexota bacterium]|nr:GNAT family N-acetyltransferase [Chloroflexota bacterium]